MRLLTEEVHLIHQATFNWIEDGFEKSLKTYIHDDPDGYHISDIIFLNSQSWLWIMFFSNHIFLFIYKTILPCTYKLI